MRRVDPAQLVGATEVGEMLDWPPRKVATYAMPDRRRVNGFPAPVAELGCGRIWLRSEVEEWARGKGYLQDPVATRE